MPNVLMKCGCRAHGTSNGKPVCAVHLGLTPDAEIIAETPDLTLRKAKCTYCNSTKPSSVSLPFFTYQPEQEKDNYYCGCRGFD